MNQLFNVPIHEFGNQFEISGVILQHGAKRLTLLFPTVDNQVIVETHTPTTEEWGELLNQLDTCNVVVNTGDNKLPKIIVRKTERIIDQHVMWNVFRRDGYRCQYCNANHVPLTIDHVICWEDLGATTENNLITACRKCNKTRGNTEFIKWLSTPYLESKMLNFHDPAHQLKLLSDFHYTAALVPKRPIQRSR